MFVPVFDPVLEFVFDPVFEFVGADCRAFGSG
jgi:hypothetical protein